MSLKPTPKNTAVVRLALSAETWARHAIGGDKIAGPEGFENYRNGGGWFYPLHYRNISKTEPQKSSTEALAEMSDIRASLVDEIIADAQELDRMVMRLQRMEEQMSEVTSLT